LRTLLGLLLRLLLSAHLRVMLRLLLGSLLGLLLRLLLRPHLRVMLRLLPGSLLGLLLLRLVLRPHLRVMLRLLLGSLLGLLLLRLLLSAHLRVMLRLLPGSLLGLLLLRLVLRPHLRFILRLLLRPLLGLLICICRGMDQAQHGKSNQQPNSILPRISYRSLICPRNGRASLLQYFYGELRLLFVSHIVIPSSPARYLRRASTLHRSSREGNTTKVLTNGRYATVLCHCHSALTSLSHLARVGGECMKEFLPKFNSSLEPFMC